MDPINKAIAEIAEPGTIAMTTVQVKLATGKPVVIAIPVDLTPLDALCIQRVVLDLFDQLQQKKPQIIVPSPGGILVPQ